MTYTDNDYPNFTALLRQRPHARARIVGSKSYPDIRGIVRFYQTAYGVVVVAEVKGLPNPAGYCSAPIFGFHIHEGTECTGNETDPFANVKTHYNPHACPHPYHAGDLPPLFGADGRALSIFLSNRFTVREILGRTVVIHSSPDDFSSQPAGNSGAKIACGEIVQ